ncbi:MAG: hypothetical protein E6K70_10145 [Planctomycetota bacterium]|nr:MAG: hypothetical protein E6K70_10145 [Planctomycetota bacterium]
MLLTGWTICARPWKARSFGPFDPGGFGEVAFILKDGIVVEYMQYYDLSHWFGEPNPPGWQPERYSEGS